MKNNNVWGGLNLELALIIALLVIASLMGISYLGFNISNIYLGQGNIMNNNTNSKVVTALINDSGGNPVKDATVKIINNSTNDIVEESTTDENGEAVFTNIPDDIEIKLVVDGDDIFTTEKIIAISDNNISETIVINRATTIAYDLNGGTGATPPKSKIMPLEEINIASSDSITPPPFKMFTSWNTAADRSGVTYLPGISYPFATNATLFAQYDLITNTYENFEATVNHHVYLNMIPHHVEFTTGSLKFHMDKETNPTTYYEVSYWEQYDFYEFSGKEISLFRNGVPIEQVSGFDYTLSLPVTVLVNNGNIKVFEDGNLVINYTDPNPYLIGYSSGDATITKLP